jgi:hypothetical protein
MPTLGASIVASLVAWVLDDLISPFANMPVRVLANLAVTVWVFYRVRRFLVELRGQ